MDVENLLAVFFDPVHSIFTISSNRPGLRTAGSSISSRFVAPSTKTPFSSSIPSSSAKNWLRTRSATCESADPAPPAGDQGINLIKENDAWRGLPGLAKNLPHPSFRLPYVFGKESRAFDRDKVYPDSRWQSALANRVLPHPGGPERRIPLGGLIPAFSKRCGVFQGPFDRFHQMFFHRRQSPHVLPADIGDLHKHLADGGRFDLP